jgi:hypothetical protein
MLTFLASSSSFTVAPSLSLVIDTIAMFMVLFTGVVTAMKGLWLWLVAGALTAGPAFLYSAFRPPAPDSLWARRIVRRRTSDASEAEDHARPWRLALGARASPSVGREVP